MQKSAIQLSTLREYGETTADRIELAGTAGFEGVELADVPTEDELGDVSLELAAHDLDVAGAHVDIETLETEPDVVAERFDQLGCDHVVVPSLPEEAFETTAAVDEAAHRLTTLSEELSAYGLDLSYHTHEFEFQSLDGPADRMDKERATAFDWLLRQTDDHVGIELDIGWAVAGGADPVALLDRVDERVTLVHITDTADGKSVQIGNGDVDLDTCVEAVRTADVEWAIYEYHEPDDPETAVEDGYARLRDLLR